VGDDVDHRAHPEEYRVGRGEQGVFGVEPYKGELLPLWRFATPELAAESSAAIRAAFDAYLAAGDFVGADMARKYLQMGYTRSRRYARHRGGRKYDGGEELPPDAEDPVKAESARIFKAAWDAAAADETYRRLKAEHQRQYG
jgi:hypothetical protein